MLSFTGTPLLMQKYHITDKPISYQLPSGPRGQQLGQGLLLMFL